MEQSMSKEARVYNVIKRYRKVFKICPTIAQLRDETKLSNNAQVYNCLITLERHGYIVRKMYKQRAITITGKEFKDDFTERNVGGRKPGGKNKDSAVLVKRSNGLFSSLHNLNTAKTLEQRIDAIVERAKTKEASQLSTDLGNQNVFHIRTQLRKYKVGLRSWKIG